MKKRWLFRVYNIMFISQTINPFIWPDFLQNLKILHVKIDIEVNFLDQTFLLCF